MFKMHYLMMVVVFVKSLSCLFHAVSIAVLKSLNSATFLKFDTVSNFQIKVQVHLY